MTFGRPHLRSSTAYAAVASLIALALLLAPALWNGYPLLQYDTGGYLARWYEGYLVPSRSTVFGVYLHLGEGLHFWPIVVVQSALTVWVLTLTLSAFGVVDRWRMRLPIIVALTVVTTLPWLTSVLLTDIFVGLAVLAVHLLAMHRRTLSRVDQFGLFLLIAFAAATHTATLAVLMAVVAIGAVAKLVLGGIVCARGLILGGAAMALGAAMLLATNAALSGRLAWTPGGYGIAFGRMLQDRIVARYLNEHCPDQRLQLCTYRDELPATADEFLWSYSVFNRLGRFTGLGEEMRTIVLESLVAYPGPQIAAAVRATAHQLGLVATGGGVHDSLPHTYGIIERFIPKELSTMRAARQQHGALDFTRINQLHVPIAWLSMMGLLLMLVRFLYDKKDDLALLAATATIGILANAFVCGALSGPHDRYGARIVWIATLVMLLAAARAWAGIRLFEPFGRGAAIAGPSSHRH